MLMKGGDNDEANSIALLLVACLTLVFAATALAQGHSGFGETVAGKAQTDPAGVAEVAIGEHPTGAP